MGLKHHSCTSSEPSLQLPSIRRHAHSRASSLRTMLSNRKHRFQCPCLSVFLMSCLRHICGISLKDHISNAAILSACQAPSMESQLGSKRLRWYGHVCRMLDSRLPKVMLFGQVKGSKPPGRPRKIWNDVVLSDFQQLSIIRPYRDAQNQSA